MIQFKNTSVIALAALLLFLPIRRPLAEESKGHKNHSSVHEGEHESEQEDEHGHGHEEEEGASGNVGPEKGILAVSEHRGFQLSREALQNFEIKSERLPITGKMVSVPRSSVVYSKDSVGIFQVREGFFKRISAVVIKRDGDRVQIQVAGLKEGDEIVTHGAGFLRIAELDAGGGIAHGHSH